MSTTKTIREWFEELPEPYRTQALGMMEDPNGTSACMSIAISGSFSWKNSDQGVDYWKALHEKYLSQERAAVISSAHPIDASAPLGTGKRFNEGKTRHDLVPAYAQEQYARVLTVGAAKYHDRNWENGMAWSKVISSLERHLQAIKRGEDYDKESGLLHAAHVMCNAAFLTEYYKIYPQGDDRPHWYLKRPRIALDIDEVLADWVGHWTKHHGQVTPEFWNFDAKIKEKFDAKKDDKDFWLSIPALIDPKDLPFEPCCYVTSRNIPTEWTEEWIASKGFPTMPVITVGHGQSKVQVLKDNKIDIFVDDRFENFAEINSAGICCYLMDAPHNRRYEVGHKRIKSLKELVER